MNRGRYYKVWRSGDVVHVTATDPDAKQVFFSWGSGSDRVAAQFYGREVERTMNPDWNKWMWSLDADAVDEMIHCVDDHIDDKNYYSTRGEIARAKELSKMLKKVSR